MTEWRDGDEPASHEPASHEPGQTVPKATPHDLALRAKPRPVTRINRRLLMLLAATGLLLILAATILALDPPRLFERDRGPRELYRTGNMPKPSGLDSLPRRYSDLPSAPVEPAIALGPALMGDIGPAVVEKERDIGLEPPASLAFRPDPESDALRAERIRQARLEQQARESMLFFKLRSKPSQSVAAAASGRAAADASRTAEPGQPALLQAAPSRQPAMPGLHSSEPRYPTQARAGDVPGQEADRAIYNPHRLQDPISPYQVMAGTIIAASLITGINADLPGPVIAQVTEPVYDTVSGQHLLIPQGSRVIGRYDSVIAFGQERALVVWQRIILPDGSSLMIEALPASDRAGYAGLEDQVDFHTWRLLKGIAFSTLLGVSTELTFGQEESELVRAIREASQESASQVGERLVERNLDIPPSITIRPGWPLSIIVQSDLVLRPYGGE